MPINTDLSIAPYFDDFDTENQYYRVMFKPGYAVQARELTQLQTILQNQIEQFGDNIFKEGSIVKGCNFTNLEGLEFVKITDDAQAQNGTNVLDYVSKTVVENINGIDIEVDWVYELTGGSTGLKADIVAATQGSESRPPNLNTFFINYKNTSATGEKRFRRGEDLSITLYKYKRGTTTELFNPTPFTIPSLNVYDKVIADNPETGKAFGIQAAPGIVFQKGHFLFAASQILIVSKYSQNPDNVSVGYSIRESLRTALQDNSLYDNANGSRNENAPGADRLRLVPELQVIPTDEADIDSDFFTLIRYQNGNAITLRDVSQYNVLGEELARRTYEESGNYILEKFPLSTDDRIPSGETSSEVHVLVGTGTAYVKGYRVENSAERAFPIDQISTTEIINNQAVSTNYGNYVDVLSINGNLDLDHSTPVQLRNAANTVIGSAFVTNFTPERVYFGGVRMSGGNNFADVERLSDGSGFVEIDSSVKSATKRALIFNTGMMGLFQTDDTLIPVRIRESATQTGNQITLSANANEDFVCTNEDILVIDSSGVYIPVLSATTDVNNSVLTVNLDPAASSNPGVTVYYNKRLIGSQGNIEPYNKVVAEPYVKINSNIGGGTVKYSLGFPDVFSIESIVDASGDDYTSSFRLNPNQKDTYYDLSYMEYIPGRPQPTGLLTVKLKVFEISPSTGEYYFTINSYPSTLDLYDIPVYVSDSGTRFNLRECFDFRPYVDKDGNVDYTDTTPGSAGTVSSPVGTTSPTFANYGTPLLPAVDQAITTDIEYYLSRVDTIVCNSYGEITLVKGAEQKFAVPPKLNSDQLAIANVFIPGFPALSSRAADSQRKREYAVKPKPTGVKNYTMKDLHSLEKKIDNMAYYISLSQLESETQNLTILDENGLNRFKNGFIVDPFNNLSLANVDSPEFNAAVPFNQKILTPSVKTFPLDLKYKTSTGAALFPSTSDAKVATLATDSEVRIINQPYASGFRNCVSNFYKYVGNGVISPPYDAAYDTTTNPVTLEIDLSTPLQDLVDNIQEFIPLTDVTTETIAQRPPAPIREDFGNRWFMGGWGGVRFDAGFGAGFDVIETTTRSLELGETTVTSNFVGDFMTDFRFEPFMASRDIKIYMSGLRPNVRHYFFFDKQDVNQHIIPGSAANDVNNIQRAGAFGAAVETDENGVLRAVFRIPPETFYVGDRVLEIVDVDSYDNIESAATSKGFVTYRAYNFSVERTALTTSTRAPTWDIATTTTTRNVARRPIGRDPIAQTFFIKKGMGAGSNSIFLSKVDVYFKRKSDTNGISLQLREVINGYPSNQVIPFSNVHKLPADVNVSDDASALTTFEFEAPVRLDVEKEYALVLQPDASDPNYLIFISKVGGVDLTPGDTQGSAIVQDWGDGVLFSSTNNSAWKSYQDEDMKFTLHRKNFSEETGSVTLTHNDHEFLTVDNITARFTQGELIYQTKSGAGTIGVVQGEATVTGTNLDNTYAAGDFILIESAGEDPQIYGISSVDGSTQLTLDRPSIFGDTGATGTPIVVGYLSYFNTRNPYEMHLERSSAKVGRTFNTAETIVGVDSGATANVSVINNINLSYVQPMIMKANDSVSTTTLTGSFVPVADLNASYSIGMKFNDNNTFTNQGVVLYSRSNDPAGAKPFEIQVNMANSGNSTSTPFVDIEVTKLLAYQYKITNDSASTAKYVSKIIELASDLDAEDLHLIVTGYRPNGTNIKAYIKPQNAFDSDDFANIDWVELELFEGVNTYSSSSNTSDYREFKYRVPASDKDGNGVITYTSNSGEFSGYRKFAIKIELLSPNIHNAPTLMDYRGIALT